MRLLKIVFGLALAIMIWQIAFALPQRMSYSDTKKTIERIKDQSARFKDNFDDDVSRAGVNSHTRHEMKHRVERFEEATKDLKKRYHKDNAAVQSVNEVLSEAAAIDSFMEQQIVSPRVQDQWLLLRQDLDLLAGSYNMVPEWPMALARAETPPPAVVMVPAPPGRGQIGDLVEDIQTDAAAFQANVRSALANSPAPGVDAGNPINQYIGDFMISADKLRISYSGGYSSPDVAQDVLSRAEVIDQYMRDHPLSDSAQQGWIRLRNDMIRLAAACNLSPGWLSR